ncbi:MAG: dolichol kinase [Candidatus Bathyarchaeota archaeon]|nr:dolichol kinase [Candidatus Bathyarchaeota archaeon]
MIYIEEITAAFILLIWVIFVVMILAKKFYSFMMKKGLEKNVAVYYNRKLIHILTGGLCASIIPLIFKSFILPFIMSLFLAAFLFYHHRKNRLMYWFQTSDNSYEVSFCIMWGLIIALGWILTGGDFRIGVLPVVFMSVGDAITGIVRNAIYRRRTKSWWGNLAMALFSMSIGAVVGLAGIIAGAVASLVEHFEFKPIDDNVLVPATSFLILLLARIFAPWSFTL